jgi:hypothetical protein
MDAGLHLKFPGKRVISAASAIPEFLRRVGANEGFEGESMYSLRLTPSERHADVD